MQRQRHLTVSNCLLGEVIVNNEHVAAGVISRGRLAVLAVIHKELANCSTSHRSDVLHRSGVGSGSRNDNGVVECTVLLQGLANVSNRRGLLTNGYVNADHVLATLVQNSVDSNGSLTRLTVANDELTLAAANRNHRVDSQKTSLHRLAHRGTVDNTGGLELDGARMGGANLALAVDGLAQRVYNAAEHSAAYRDVHDATGGAALVAFLDDVYCAKQNGANLIAVEVLSKAVHGLASLAALKLQQLAGHGTTQSRDAGNTVANLVDMGNLLRVNGRCQTVEFLGQCGCNALCIDL